MTEVSKTNGGGAEYFAAVDLGSNSFHMVVAREMEGGHLQYVDRLRDPVRLASGLDADGTIKSETREQILACLARFGQRLATLPRRNVRVVGTNALRNAYNAGEFLAIAEQTLGHPIDVISGLEEARLIHQGVTHDLGAALGKHLVVDIGGGSTELIVGQNMTPLYLESLAMGCVTHTEAFFSHGKISAKNFDKAITAAKLELRPVKRIFVEMGWDVSIGSSGTIRSIQKILATQEGSADELITHDGLKKLLARVCVFSHAKDLDLTGLRKERTELFPGGLAVLIAVFESLEIRNMTVSEFALREGILFDLLGRRHNDDIRDRTIDAMQTRYAADRTQASRVEQIAVSLLQQTGDSWGLERAQFEPLLRWAARVHEIGLAVAHAQYNRHGAYLLEFSDMPGFSRQDQKRLALLVRGHRKKLNGDALDGVSVGERLLLARACVLLRLAVLVNRSRNPRSTPNVMAMARHNNLEIIFPTDWLNGHPLTQADLEEEVKQIAATKIDLRFSSA